MNIITKFMTENDCYKQGKKITPRGIIVHSTATPGVMAERWYSLWNKPGVDKCVHAFVDDKGVYQYLPWNHRGWHAGGKANDTHIGFEICEPKDLNNKEYFKKAWANAVELAVYLCQKYNISLDEILGHYEAHKKGLASNHADPGHWFLKHGKSMDDFREDVKRALGASQEAPKQHKEPKTIKVGSRVKVKPGAKTYDGKGLADFVYKEIYDVIQVDGDRVVIGKGKTVTAAVKVQDLILL